MPAVSPEPDADDTAATELPLRGIRVRVSDVTRTVEMYVQVATGPMELIRALANYVPAGAGLLDVTQHQGALVLRFQALDLPRH